VIPSLEARTRKSVPQEEVPKVLPSQLWPRLWHKVEHVHPGALRGRAVGSAPDIRRTPGTVPLLHFSLGFKDSETLLAHRAQSHQGEPRWSQGRLAASLELLEPPSASSTSGPRPAPLRSLRVGRSLPSAHSESPIPRGVPVPRYLARRTRALHSDPRVRALNSSGPGFSPVARCACRVVLRSCFRPGTRLGLPRLPPLATSAPVQDRIGPGTRPGRLRYKTGSEVCRVGSEDLSLRLPVSAFRLDSPRRARLPTHPEGFVDRLTPKGSPKSSGRAGWRCHDLFDPVLNER